jgi:hypothetical protein
LIAVEPQRRSGTAEPSGSIVSTRRWPWSTRVNGDLPRDDRPVVHADKDELVGKDPPKTGPSRSTRAKKEALSAASTSCSYGCLLACSDIRAPGSYLSRTAWVGLPGERAGRP